MGLITQYSRMSHHTIYGQTGFTFSVPTTEDFTDGSWSIYDLCLSEIAVNEDEGKVFIRLGDEIKQFQMIGASGSISLSLSEVLAAGNTTNGNNIIMGSASFISSASGERFLNIGDEYVYLHAEDASFDTNLIVYPNRIVVDSVKGIEYAGDYSGQFTTHSLVDKAYVDSSAGIGAQTLEEVLILGNTTGTQSIVMGTGSSISSTNGAGRLRFDADSVVNYVQMDSIWGSNSTIFSLDGYNINHISTDSIGTSEFDMTPDYLDMSSTDGINLNRFRIEPDSMVITTPNGLGLEYSADYSSTFVDRSIIDKSYVDTAIAGVVGATGPQGLPGLNGADGVDGATGPAGPQGATGSQGPIGATGPTGLIDAFNGLTFSAGYVKMGGSLIESTTIETSTFDFKLINSTTQPILNSMVSGKGGELNIGVGVNSQYADNIFDVINLRDKAEEVNIFSKQYTHIGQAPFPFTSGDLHSYTAYGNGLTINFASDEYQIESPNITITGNLTNVLQYEIDNSATFATHSLVDKNYVDSNFTSSTNVSNGLTFSAGYVKMGGSLIESTTIDTSTFDFKLRNSATQPILNSMVSGKGGEINIGIGVNSQYADNVNDILNLRDKADEVNVFSKQYTHIGQAPFPYTPGDPNSYTAYGNGITLNVATDEYNIESPNINITGNGQIINTASDGTDTTLITQTPTSITITMPGIGIEYGADYSATYTDRSLVDKAYVDIKVGYEIGSFVGGGVLASFWTLSDGTKEGLVISTTNLGATAWSDVSSTLIGTTAQSNYYGLTNSNAIVAQVGETRSAAALAKAHTGGGYTDWYLPAVFEMQEVIKNKLVLHKVLGDIDGLQTLYWTSTESTSTNASYVSVVNSSVAATSKANSQFGGTNLETRAVRKITL